MPLNEFDEKSFRFGDGKELERKYPKMASLRSSSALAYNYFYNENYREFEYRVKILKDKVASNGKISEVYSNIDVYEISSDSLIYNEVKFLELFDYNDDQNYKVPRAYLNEERYLLKNIEDIRLFNESFKNEFKLYNFPQIMKMILAALVEYESNEIVIRRRKEIVIRNIGYEVNDFKYEEMSKFQRLYNNEVERAKEIINDVLTKLSHKNLKISFEYITFQEAFETRKKVKFHLSDDYLENRYFFKRIKYFPSIGIKDEISFKELVYSAFEKKIGKNYTQDLLKRINLEFEFIENNKLENDFLFLYKLVNKIKEDKQFYLLNSDINASVISYLLGISHVNPYPTNKEKDFRYVPIDFFINDYSRIYNLRLENEYKISLKEWIKKEDFSNILIEHGLGINSLFIKNEDEKLIQKYIDDRHTKLKNEYICLYLISSDLEGVLDNNIDFDDLKYQLNAEDLIKFGANTFGYNEIVTLMKKNNGKNNEDYAKAYGIIWSSRYITTPLIEKVLKSTEISIFNFPTYQEDLFIHLVDKGVENSKAFEISSSLGCLTKDNLSILKKHDVEEYLIHAIESSYLSRKTARIDRIVLNIRLCELNKRIGIKNNFQSLILTNLSDIIEE